MKVLELKGYHSLKVLNSFQRLMLGVKMLPHYAAEDYESFFDRVSELPEDKKEKLIKEACLFVDFEKDELESIVCFVADPNGIPYGPQNLKNLSVDQLFEIVVAVMIEVSKLKVGLVTDKEKKNLKTTESMSEKSTQGTLN